MIEIFRRAEGKDRLIRSYDTFEDTFRDARAINVHTLAQFGYDPNDRINASYLFGELDVTADNFELNRNRYVCYENDKFVTPDRLVGLYRNWHSTRRRYRYRSWSKYAYGHWRAPKTTNERRWAHAWDDDEFAPSTGFARGRRHANMLPNLWDDCMTHNDKSWKTQSNRRHQWKNTVKCSNG